MAHTGRREHLNIRGVLILLFLVVLAVGGAGGGV